MSKEAEEYVSSQSFDTYESDGFSTYKMEVAFDAGVESVKRSEAEVKAEAIDWIQNVTKKQIANINFELSDKVRNLEAKCFALECVLKKSEWHNLEENPNDLPIKNGDYLCKLESNFEKYGVKHFDTEPLLKYDNNWKGQGFRVVAWKEIE